MWGVRCGYCGEKASLQNFGHFKYVVVNDIKLTPIYPLLFVEIYDVMYLQEESTRIAQLSREQASLIAEKESRLGILESRRGFLVWEEWTSQLSHEGAIQK